MSEMEENTNSNTDLDSFSTSVDITRNPKLRTRNTIVIYTPSFRTEHQSIQHNITQLVEDLRSLRTVITTYCIAKIAHLPHGFAVCFGYPDTNTKPDYKLSRYILSRFEIIEARTVPDTQKRFTREIFNDSEQTVLYTERPKYKRKSPEIKTVSEGESQTDLRAVSEDVDEEIPTQITELKILLKSERGKNSALKAENDDLWSEIDGLRAENYELRSN